MVAILKMPRMFTDGAERRVFPRKAIQASVAGRRMDHSIHALQQPSLTLRLRDLSLGGLSALSDQALEAGERLSVTFPPLAERPGWDASGRVIRCQPSFTGYQVAVAFDSLLAAA